MSGGHYLEQELSELTSRDPAILGFLSCLDGLWYWDLEQPEHAWMNARFWEVLGYDPAGQTHLDSEWQHLIHPDDLRRLRESLDAPGVDPGRPVDQELRCTHQDGSTVWVRCRGLAIRDPEGRPIRLLGVHRDVTALKRAEEEVRCLASRLATASRELEAFTYSVSHDLRAPLRAVDGFSRILVEDSAARLDDEGRRMLGLIRSETQRMNGLLGAVLSFSRLSREKVETEIIDMRDLAQEVFDELAALHPGRQLRLAVPPLPSACGTRAMIRKVWMNLLSNAIKFTKERAVGEIEIGAREGDDGAPVYSVKDNGAGFDMRHVGRLFSMFQQLHSGADYPGIGAGLAFVQRIVQRHQGRVWAEGEVGRGATFYFTIPNPKP